MLCPCGVSVLQVGDPAFLVDEEPHPLGIYTPSGTKVSLRDIASAGTGHEALRRHSCRAGDVDPSTTLFRVVE